MDNIFIKFSDETHVEATAEELEGRAAVGRNLWDEASENKSPSRTDRRKYNFPV